MSDFEDGFFAGYYGKQLPENSSDEFKDGYQRATNTKEAESSIERGMKNGN